MALLCAILRFDSRLLLYIHRIINWFKFFGIEIGLILSGAVVTETIFAWPGLGRLLVDSVGMRDLPVVQAVILMITLIIVLSNLFVDILHALLDPKVSLARTLGGAG